MTNHSNRPALSQWPVVRVCVSAWLAIPRLAAHLSSVYRRGILPCPDCESLSRIYRDGAVILVDVLHDQSCPWLASIERFHFPRKDKR